MRLRAHLSHGMRRLHGAGSRLQYGAIGFVFLVCLAVIAVEAANLWQQRNKEMSDAWQEAANLARSLAQHAEDTVRTADVSIIGLVHRLQLDGTSPEKLDQLSRITAARLTAVPALPDVMIIDASGRCVRRRIPFRRRIASRLRGEHRVSPYPSRRRPASRQTAARRGDRGLDHPSVAPLRPRRRQFRRHRDRRHQRQLPRSVLPHLQDRRARRHPACQVDGTVLVRHPLFEASIGRNFSSSPLFRDYLPKQRAGSVEIKSPTDGVIRLNSYRATSEYPLVVGVALAKDEVLAAWRDRHALSPDADRRAGAADRRARRLAGHCRSGGCSGWRTPIANPPPHSGCWPRIPAT